MKPTLLVEVALPAMFKPESVVVPNPVDETERNELFVEPVLFVDEAIEKRDDAVLPNLFNREKFEVGVVVPSARNPALERKIDDVAESVVDDVLLE